MRHGYQYCHAGDRPTVTELVRSAATQPIVDLSTYSITSPSNSFFVQWILLSCALVEHLSALSSFAV